MSVAIAGAAAAIIGAGSSIYFNLKNIDEAEKARDEQRAALAKATAEAKAEKDRIANLEKERLDRLRKRGAGLPPSLITGMSGVTGPASTTIPKLG